jgi:Sulfotransferase domain
MGQGASKPGPPTTKMQVLGLGMSRTGTASFSRALEILLNGPAYHGGAQLLHGDSSHMLRWNDILRISYKLRHHPESVTVAERVYQKYLLAKQLEGYVAVTDAPSNMYVEVLMELYPDAKIVVTTRDVDKWWKSIEPVVQKADKQTYTNLLLFWVPGLRHWAEYVDLCRYGRYGELYYLNGELDPGPYCYTRHYDYLERVVPKEKLHYYDIKSGWGPLCEILDLPVPDVDFPFENDAVVIQSAFKKAAFLGMGLWAGFLTGMAALTVGTAYAMRSGLLSSARIHDKIRPLGIRG